MSTDDEVTNAGDLPTADPGDLRDWKAIRGDLDMALQEIAEYRNRLALLEQRVDTLQARLGSKPPATKGK